MSDSLNNKELVAVGHQFAKAMSSDTPILDIAKIVSRLAERLDCTTAALHATQAQRDQLAVENAALKSVVSENWNLRDVLRQLIARRPGGCYFIKWEPLLFKALNETPATDAFLAELRSSGLDEMAVAYRKFASEEGCSCNMQSSYNLTAERAESYAAYVRRQGVVQ